MITYLTLGQRGLNGILRNLRSDDAYFKVLGNLSDKCLRISKESPLYF